MQRKDSTRLEKSNKRLLGMRRTAGSRLTSSIRREDGEILKALARAEAILDALPSIFAVVQGGKVKEITPKGLSRLGYSHEEIQDMDFIRLVHPGSRSLLEGYERSFGGNGGSSDPQELELLTKDGETVICDLILHRIAYQGHAAFLAEIAPAAPRKERERSLISSHKDDLIANMSSGLVRKLAPSVSALNDYVAQLKTRPRLSGRSAASDQELIDAVNKLDVLTRRLRLLSREEYDRSPAVRFDLGKVVQEAVSQMEKTLNNDAGREAPIHIQCYLRPASPVEGDPEEIRSVVTGLITNAIEAMPDGGELYITAEENAGHACVYIQDSGTSISEELMPKIMDPFFTTKGKGSDGLGLCVARAVLKKHNGDLYLESSNGGGTTITLRMPIARGGAGPGKSCVRKRKNMWIMIMEEDRLIGDLLFHVLSSKGYNVETAEAFSEFLERLKSRTFDLVIAGTVTGDIQALIRRIRNAAPRTRLALIGELGDEDSSRRFPRVSVDLVIGKPIDMGWTLDRISEILIGRTK